MSIVRSTGILEVDSIPVHTPSTNDCHIALNKANGGIYMWNLSSWQVLSAGKGVPYDMYVANISQSGTNAPVAVVLQDDIGITTTRVNVGIYALSCTGKFIANKSFFSIIIPYDDGYAVLLNRENNDTISITTQHNGTPIDDFPYIIPIEIKIWP